MNTRSEANSYEQASSVEVPLPASSSLIPGFFFAILGFLLLLIVGIGLFTHWSMVVASSSIIITMLIIVLVVSIPLGIIGFGAKKVYFSWLEAQHAKLDMQMKQEQVLAEQDRRIRDNETHKMRMYLSQTLLYADAQGNRPFVYDQYSGQVLEVASGNFVANVPHTYSPRIEIASTSAASQQKELADAHGNEQPGLETVISELTPNALEFAFGLDPLTAQLVKTTLPKSVHIQLLGASGQGKSRQATSILTQLCSRNDTEHLQLALIDCEGETTEPFQRLPHVRYVADEPKEAAKTLRGLVNELERRDMKKIAFPVILIFVEEFLNLRRTMPGEYRDEALEDYTTLALRGRKRGMFLFSIGQTAYTEKAIRDAQMQFLSSMAFAIKPTAARSAGFTNTELLNKLYDERRPGQFLLERPAGDSILLAPYVETSRVPGLLSDCKVLAETPQPDAITSSVASTVQPPAQPTEPALDARSLRIRDLLKQGVSQRQIVQEIWGVSNGAAYTKAQQELAKIIATLI